MIDIIHFSVKANPTKYCELCNSYKESYFCFRDIKHPKICTDCFRIIYFFRNNFHTALLCSLKTGGYSYVWQYLSFSLQDARNHFESQFEPWMNWLNNGRYRKGEWNDDDESTWVWQIDHIIPKSNFILMSPFDSQFKECWALDNLRPIAAKLNLKKGNRVK